MTNLNLPGIWVMDPDPMEERIRERYLTVEEGTAMSSIRIYPVIGQAVIAGHGRTPFDTPEHRVIRISLFQDLPGSLIEFDNGDMAWVDGDVEVLSQEEP
jgi:hypothetical protein